MRKPTKLATGLAFAAAVAGGCGSSQETVYGGTGHNILGAESEYRNPQNFVITSLDAGKLVLKGCITGESYPSENLAKVITLGAGFAQDENGSFTLTGINTVKRSGFVNWERDMPVEDVLPGGKHFPTIEPGAEVFKTESQTVECGRTVDIPQTMYDRTNETTIGETIPLGEHPIRLLGSVVHGEIQPTGELGPIEVIAHGPRFNS